MKKVLAWTLAPIFAAIGLWCWSWLGKVNALAMNQERYEQVSVKQQEINERLEAVITQQTVVNELEKQEINSLKEDQERQWDSIKRMLDKLLE